MRTSRPRTLPSGRSLTSRRSSTSGSTTRARAIAARSTRSTSGCPAPVTRWKSNHPSRQNGGLSARLRVRCSRHCRRRNANDTIRACRRCQVIASLRGCLSM
jgi:hypothetical protein